MARIGGLALWFADWFNEIVNSLVLQATDRAALWTATGPTAYQFLIGLNVEISLMFAIMGIYYVKILPADRSKRILGMPNRLAIAIGSSLAAVAVEPTVPAPARRVAGAPPAPVPLEVAPRPAA